MRFIIQPILGFNNDLFFCHDKSYPIKIDPKVSGLINTLKLYDMKALEIIASVAIGATAGLVAGYLTAPTSGKKTRKRISNEIESQFNTLESRLTEKMSEFKEGYNNQVKKLTDESKTSLNKAKEMVSIN